MPVPLQDTMQAVATLATYEGAVILLALAAVVVWGLLTGRILLSGLLQGDRVDGSSYSSSGRAQLLISTIATAIAYLTQALKNPTKFPDIPFPVVGVIAASHAAYLVGKAAAVLNVVRSDESSRREP